MNIDDFWKRLNGYGITVTPELQRRIGLDLNQERVMIRPPAQENRKARVIEYGTSISALIVARQTGVTVQYVRRVRRLLRS